MDMTGQRRIEADRETVFAALNDPEILKQCIPGCDEIVRQSDTAFSAHVTARVGPVKAKFSGAVTLTDIVPPESYTISGSGKGGPAGFAKGGAKVRLEADGAATLLNYEVSANVGGKLAQLGGRLIDGTARKMAEQFFTKFADVAPTLAPAQTVAAETTPPAAAVDQEVALPEAPVPSPSPAPSDQQVGDSGRGLSPGVWIGGIAGVIIIILLILWFR